jgi:hypothetical protein
MKDKNHECYMKVCKIPKNATLPTLYFYDFEMHVDANGYMIPFYCVVQKVYFLPHPDYPHAIFR